MPANVDGMVREGISAYRAGRKEEARALLLKAVELDEHNEQAWLWLSAVVDSVEEQRICLENVLAINPTNEKARQGLDFLKQKSGEDSRPPAKADDVLAGASFTSPAPSPFIQDTDDELPTSIEWEAPPTPTSSASSRQRIEEPSPEQYDDWVSSLNLGGKTNAISASQPAALEAAAQFASAAFTDEDEDDDLFSLGVDTKSATDPFTSGPFTTGEMPAARPSSGTEAKDKKPSNGPAKKADSLLDDLEDDVVEEQMEAEFFEDYDHAQLDAPETSELFRYIPKEIKPTRLPGTSERYPFLVLLGLFLLIILNIGAVVLLVMNFTAG